LKILIIMLVLIMSVGAACAADAVSGDDAGNGSQEILQTVQEDNILENTQNEVYTTGEGSFTDLSHEIGNATGVLNLTRDYKFNNETDNVIGITIENNNLVIEGNGHTLDADNYGRILNIDGTNVTLNNIKFINGNRSLGSAIYIDPGFSLTTNNVTFENNTAENCIVYVEMATYNSNNDKFLDATVSGTGVILAESSVLNVDNALMMSSKQLSWGFIQSMGQSNVTVLNSIFANTTSNYSAAMKVSGKTRVKNTKFINLEATITAGAIAAKEFDECIIENCTFYNVSSHKNGGAIFSDVPGYNYPDTGALIIRGTTFTNCSSGFGGAILHLGGNFIMDDSTFTDNYATFDGGAVYISYANVSIANSTFENSNAVYDGERGSFGGALYCDMSQLTLTGSNFTANSAQEGSALYLYDASYNISGNTFKGNVNFNGSYDDIFTVFDNISDIGTNVYSGEGSISIGNVNYATIIACEGMNLTLINNSIDVTTLPSRFDMRDWGWLTSVKNQGNKNACWAFGSSGAIESSILRFLGMDIDLSENNMEDMSLRYFTYGMKDFKEGNAPEAAVNYALSWFGVFDEEYDVYDQLGKISPIFAVSNSIHFQDVVIVPPRQNSTDNDAMKWALLKYGALFINYRAVGPVTEQYYDGNETVNHGVTVVGWDDNREIAGAPGKGAWIIKNTWGADRLENGFMYVSYYDTRLSTMTSSYAFPLENTVIYNKNYQYDIGGRFWYLNNSDQYRNVFVAVEDDLIAGVGTYFNDTNVEYTIRIYVNDKLVLVQSGLSPFSGYHTVKLDSYVPIKEGDEFIVEIKSNVVPISFSSRQHYIVNSSQQFVDGEWQDTTVAGYVNCVKAYTLADDTKVIDAKDISVDYDGGKYFSVTVVTADGHAVGAGETVKFTIDGKTSSVKTDSNGVAKIKITNVPKKYPMTTTYNGKSVKSTVTVKHVLTTSKVTVKKTAKKFTLKATLKINGKVVKGKWITFKFNGKTYKPKTNAKGVAQKTLSKNVIKKLKKGKTYTVKVTYLKDTIKTTVKVR
jgi:C1A family cysteine protease